nr:flagellar basal-body MS-ring/collar protein FliF [Endozoicomonas sp. OPT23]
MVQKNLTVIVIAGALLLTIFTTIWLWSTADSRDLKPLYGRQELYDTAAVIEALGTNDIPYQLHPESGQVLVSESRQRAARMTLATAGITAKMPEGLELLSGENQLGRSQFVEKAQYLRGLEGELSKTVMSLRPVRSARVHLAVPKRSAFMRDQVAPSAAVYVDLYSGVELDTEQVQGIINLVAGSLPQLSADKVSILDQNSNPLYGMDRSGEKELDRQRRYIQLIENDYRQNMARLIEPLVGAGNLRVVVNADVDFSFQENTVEAFDPEGAALRSETMNGSVPDQPSGEQADNGSKGGTGLSRVRNYELDRSVSYRRQDAYRLENINIAVILNSRVAGLDGDGAEAMLTAIRSLLANAAGIDAARGDQVAVQALPFVEVEKEDTGNIIEKAMGTNRDYLPYIYLGFGGLGVLLVIIILMMMVRRRKKNKQLKVGQPLALPQSVAGSGAVVGTAGEVAALTTPEGVATGALSSTAMAASAAGTQQIMGQPQGDPVKSVQDMAASQPEQVANVLENWIKEGEE